MRWVALADENLKEEMLSDGTNGEMDLVWINKAEEFTQYGSADGYIDLLFDNTKERIELLKNFSAKPVIVNSVITTLKEIGAPFVRINAWAGFLKRPVVEASHKSEGIKLMAEDFFSRLNKKIEWVADKPGFITARVITMIINEAWFALGENVSTKKEIDAAMKLGTNYPYGPFEWCDRIGIKNIYGLLTELSKTSQRYKPAPLLEKQATHDGPHSEY
jgi:3-hydroxybutyryl-CoA dehydrogenase